MAGIMSATEIGRRLRLIRLAKGFDTQPPIAKLLNVSLKRYNNWEKGIAPIPTAFAARLCSLTGVTMDYIYRDNMSGVPLDLASRLEEMTSREGFTAGESR